MYRRAIVTYADIGGTGYVFVAIGSTTDLGDVVLVRGTLAADGVAFDAEITVLDGTGVGDAYLRPSVATDATGLVWVAAQYDDGVDFHAYVRRTSNAGNGDLSSLEVPTDVGVANVEIRDAVLAPQGGATMALVLGAPLVELYRFDGSSWSGPAINGIDQDAWTLTALDSGMTGHVYAIAVLAGDIYIGGSFRDAFGNTDIDCIARWDGTTWHAVGGGLSSTVYAITVNGTDLLVGGSFSNAGGVAEADKIARWDGNTWHALGTGIANGSVRVIAVSGTDIFVGGSFVDVGGITQADRIARWDGSTSPGPMALPPRMTSTYSGGGAAHPQPTTTPRATASTKTATALRTMTT